MDLSAFLSQVLASLLSFFGMKNQSDKNVEAVRETNQTNYKIAQETNAANVEQAELAYKRSLPTAQVAQMMQAGMSKYGALSALQGGGSYTAPTLQSAHMDAPQQNIDFNALADRLANIPANTRQSNMVKEQTTALIKEQQRKDEELRIAIERHNQEMEFNRNEELRKQYGQNVVEMTDKLRARVERLIADKRVDRNNLTSLDSLVKSLDLDKDEYWRNAPASARDSVFEYVRGMAAEDRANRSQSNSDRAAQDTHSLSEENLRRLRLSNKDYEDEKSARLKEYAAREKAAILESLMTDSGITREQLQQSIEFDKDSDGNLIPKIRQKAAEDVNAFWNRILNYIPIRALAQVLRIILAK